MHLQLMASSRTSRIYSVSPPYYQPNTGHFKDIYTIEICSQGKKTRKKWSSFSDFLEVYLSRLHLLRRNLFHPSPILGNDHTFQDEFRLSQRAMGFSWGASRSIHYIPQGYNAKIIHLHKRVTQQPMPVVEGVTYSARRVGFSQLLFVQQNQKVGSQQGSPYVSPKFQVVEFVPKYVSLHWTLMENITSSYIIWLKNTK